MDDPKNEMVSEQAEELLATIGKVAPAHQWEGSTKNSVFRWLMETGKVVPREMARTFNCGIGMVVAVAPDRAGTLRDIFETHGLSVHEIGRLEPREAAAIRFENLDAWQRD